METTKCQRSNVILLHNRGESIRKVSKELNIPKSTVSDIINRFKKFGSVDNKEGRGRKKILSNKDVSYLSRKVKREPFQSASKLAIEMGEVCGKTMSRSTIARALKQQGIKSCTPRRKPFISDVNRKKRLNYAKKYIDMPISFWKKIIWSDESKFNVKGSDGRKRVWRPAGKALNFNFMQGTVKHGGGSVMVWGSMCYAGTGCLEIIEGIMNKEYYRDILERNLSKTTKKYRMGQNFIFMHDNDPKHKSKLVTDYLEKRNINVLDHPPQSPDLNVIEHLWDEIGRKLLEKNIRNKNDLKNEINTLWNEMSQDVTKKLVESMPKRLKEVIQNKGGPTSF